MPPDPNVYIVDDDDAVRDTLSVMLEAHGYSVQTFGEARGFLDIAAALPRGCLIVDIRMPTMDGFALQRELTDRGLLHFPIIMISAHADVLLAVRAMRAGAVDVIEKPFNSRSLLDSVASALSGLAAKDEINAAATAAAAKVNLLSQREREVLSGLVDGLPNKSIAYNLAISPRTVEIHRARIMDKMGVRSLSELVRIALAAGINPC